MEEDIDKGDVDEEHTVKEPMEEDVVKDPIEQDPVKKNIEEDAVDHNEKDDAEIKDIFVSPTPKVSIAVFVCSVSFNRCAVLEKLVFVYQDSGNDLLDLNYFSSLPDDMVCSFHIASSKDFCCKCSGYLDLLVSQFQDTNGSLNQHMDVAVEHVEV